VKNLSSVCLVGIVSLLGSFGCSSSSSATAPEVDAGHDANTTKPDTGTKQDSSIGTHDSGHDTGKVTVDAGVDTGVDEDAGEDGGAPVGIQCNPVTNEGCTGGSACDIAGDANGISGFQCYQPPNDALVCGSCDLTGESGPFCGGGTTCEDTTTSQTVGQCAQYCCTDADCGTGTCLTSAQGMPLFGTVAPSLGICVAAIQSDAGTDAAVAADAAANGDGGAAVGLECTIPATPPSTGSCVTVVGGT
jgi:hypothetical protein